MDTPVDLLGRFLKLSFELNSTKISWKSLKYSENNKFIHLGEYFILWEAALVFDGALEVLRGDDAVEEVPRAVRRHSAPGVPVEHGEPAHLRDYIL